MRKICVVTGTRAEYGILFPILKKIQNHKNLILQLLVTGTHLSKEFGYTLNDIEKDGFSVTAKIDMLLSDDTGARMARSIGVGILEFTQALEMLKPDIVLVIGDREEMFAAAVSALCLNVPVFHLHGGEVATGGHIDESIRYAIMKFSHIHLTATKQSANRIKQLGEELWRIYTVGAPFIDNLVMRDVMSLRELSDKLSFHLKKPFIIVLQHPLTLDHANSGKHMEETMQAVVSFKLPTVVIHPNGDAGSQKIIDVIERYKKYLFIRTVKNLSTSEYYCLLKNASVIVGNSSSAIVEGPTFHLPAVNIGERQEGREMAKNVLQAAYDKEVIIRAIKKAIYNKSFINIVKRCDNPYGKIGVSDKVIDILVNIDINMKLLQKKITY